MNLNRKGGDRPPFEGAYAFLLSILIGFAIADLSIQYFRPMMLPDAEPPAKPQSAPPMAQVNYYIIEKRNVFNSDGKIAPPVGGQKGEEKEEIPIPTSLPIQLTGTLVHANPVRSVASLQVRGNPIIGGFQTGDDIEGLAEMVRVERRKAIFKNASTGRLEFAEIREESKLNFGVQPKATGAELIKQDGNNFQVNRSDVAKFMDPRALPELLNQASCMQPRIIPGSGGLVDGFRCSAVKPGSLIEKLGVRAGDVIKKVNGMPISSPQVAIQLMQELKQATEIELVLERDGVDETLRYSIK